MKKVSIYILFGCFVLVSFAAIDLGFTYSQWRSYYNKTFAIRSNDLEFEADLARVYLASKDDLQKVYDILERRAASNHITFWLVYHKQKLVKSNLDESQIEALGINETDFKDFNTLRMRNAESNHDVYYVSDIGNGFQLIEGLRYDIDKSVREELVRRIDLVYKYVFSIFAAALLIFMYFFRDIMKSIRHLTGKGQRNYKGIHANSKEAELIVRGLAAYEEHSAKLALEKDILSWQVLPSLRTELMSGKTPPYDFMCTLVRTDINNFSKIYNEHDVEAFTSTINDFFTDVTHVVSRYGGLIHEFIGDEVIYYFKDEDVGNSNTTAMFAIRDINEIATYYHRRMTAERGYGFTVKSSFAYGKIHFRRFVNGFNLAGAVLIETVRILSHINEKDTNTVVFARRHVPLMGQLVTTTPYARVFMKGYSEEQELCVYSGHKPLAEILRALPDGPIELLYNYRSDADVVEMLHWMAMRAARGQYASVLKVLSVLRCFPVTKADFAVPITLAEWLEGLLARSAKVDSAERNDHLHLLASALRLIENLVPVAYFDERLEDVLRQAAASDNKRVIANALDVLTKVKSGHEPEFAKKLLEHEDNRVAANALVHEGLRGISPLVLKRIRRMLSAKDEKFVASALYALGEIAVHHKTKDPVYFQTQVELLAIVGAIPVYVSQTSQMIRKQALIAARKIGDETVLARINELVRESRSRELLEEVSQHLGEKFVQIDPHRRTA